MTYLGWIGVFALAVALAVALLRGRATMPTAAPQPAPAPARMPAPRQVAITPRDLFIDYDDADHHASQRRVTVKALHIDPRGHVHLDGYCHLRKGPRQFRVDRIKTLADADGVVLDVSAFVRAALS